MSKEPNPYQAPREAGSVRLWLPDFNWFLVGVLLIAYQLYCLPNLVATVREPHRWHGFEVTLSWWFILGSPFVVVAGVAMVVWSFRRYKPKREKVDKSNY